DQDPDLLYRGARLVEAQSLLSDQPDLLNPQEAAFLAASVAAREHEQAREAERQLARERQRRRVLAGLVAFSVVALVLAGIAVWQWNAAVGETRRADAERAAAVLAQATAQAAEATALAQGEIAASERNNAVAQATQAAMANATADARLVEAEAARADAEQQS